MCLSCTVNAIFNVNYWRDLEIWVRGRSRSLKMAPFDRSHTTSYSSSIVIMAVSFTVCVITWDIGRKTPVFHTHLCLTCTITWNPLEFFLKILTQTAQDPELLGGAKCWRKVQPSAHGARTSQTTDRRQTDGRQTDGRTAQAIKRT